MGIEYVSDDLSLAVSITDISGDFIDSLDDIEREALYEGLHTMLQAFRCAIRILRVERSKQNGMEGQNEGMGRG